MPPEDFLVPDIQIVFLNNWLKQLSIRREIEEELKAANQQLNAANRQLRASEQQLRASNEQLKAGEQQLRAINRQLRASEQQLRASEQQLRASEQQLRATDQQLRNSEKRYRMAADYTYDWEYWQNPDGTFNYISPSCERITGYAAKDFTDTPELINEIVFLEDKEVWNRHRQTAIKTKKYSEIEFRIKRRDGQIRWISHYCNPVINPQGDFLGFRGSNCDITERKTLEIRSQRLDRNLKMLSRCNQMLVRITNQQDLLQSICDNIVRIGQYRLTWVGFVEHDKKKSVRPLAKAGFGEEFLEKYNITWEDTERGRGPVGVAIRTNRPSITNDVISDSKFAPWRDEAVKYGYKSVVALPLITNGKTLGVLEIYDAETDAFDADEVKLLLELVDDVAFGITALRRREDQRKAEEALLRAAEEWRTTFDSIIDMVSIHDRNYKIIRANKAFADRFKMDPQDVIGKTCYELIHGINEPPAACPYRHTLETKKPEKGECFEPHLGLYLEVSTSPIFNEKNEIFAFVQIIRDITARKNIEKNQRLAELGELVADMAHEVNNPLMIISGNAELSLFDGVEDEEIKNNLKIIRDECSKAKDIIQRLLKFSRPSKGERKETDINGSIESVIKLIEHQFELNSIKIKKDLARSLPPITIDEKQIEEVLLNLLNNAGDAMTSGGIIEISTSLEEGFVRIDVKDSGIGMNDENLAKIFEPFHTTKEKGTGLGLSVCYGIVKAHNGELKFESEPGKGTTASLHLPLGKEGNSNV